MYTSLIPVYEESMEETSFQCRFCLEQETDACNLIVPCKCKGSMLYIHESCLYEWRTSCRDRENQCPSCGTRYLYSQFDLAGYTHFISTVLFIGIVYVIDVTAFLYDKKRTLFQGLVHTFLVICYLCFIDYGLINWMPLLKGFINSRRFGATNTICTILIYYVYGFDKIYIGNSLCLLFEVFDTFITLIIGRPRIRSITYA